MKHSVRTLLLGLGLLSTLDLPPSTCSAQGTAFTYQGRLNDGSAPANGIYDFRFAIHDAASGGGDLAVVTNSATAVSNGLFTVTLDFGAGVFTGADRWLDIGVRTNGDGAFTALTPWQAFTATPYAQLAGGVPTAAITGDMLAPGAVGSMQLATGAVQADHIAPGAITASQLAKPPRAGSVSSGSMALDFGQGDFTVNFSPAFSNAPIVTLALQPYSPALGEQAVLYVKNQSAAGFTGRFSSPAPVQKLSAYGVYSSAAIVNGAPAICAAGTPASIQFLRADPYGSSWSAPLKLFLNEGGQDYMRLTVVNGNPAIAFHSATGAVRFVRAMDVNGAAWGTPANVVVSSSDSFSFLSFAVVNGNPAIAYAEFPAWDLKYVRATDANGTAWGTPVAVATAGDVGRSCSLAVVNGRPAISYEDLSAGAVKYIRATDADGATWGAPVVVDATHGWQTALAVVNGRPAIGYARPSGGTHYVRANDADGTAWGAPVMVGDYGADLSLQIVNGRPAMSFIAGGLRYARAADANGDTWRPPAVLDAEAGAGGTGLLVLSTGVPAISYFGQFSYAEPEGTLRFVREPQVYFNINWLALEP